MPPLLYSVAALGSCHVPDESVQSCVRSQLSLLRAHQSAPFAQLVADYGECAQRAREAEVRAGQLDKEAAELRDEVASLALRCAASAASGSGDAAASTSTATTPTNTNSAAAARALAARAEAYRSDLQRARAELSSAYRDRADHLERAEAAEQRERKARARAAEALESLLLSREQSEALRAKLLSASRELDAERAARELAMREARARAEDRDRAQRRADELSRDNSDLVSRLVAMREQEADRLEQINRLHEEATEARRKVQVEGAADRQLFDLLRRRVSSAAGAAGAAGSALLGAAAAAAAGGGGSRRATAEQAAAAAPAAAPAPAAEQQPAYYASLREKMGLPDLPTAALPVVERRLPRAPAAVGAAVHAGGLVALAWEPPPLVPIGGGAGSGHIHHHHLHPHHHQAAGGGGRHLATGGADRTVRIWDAKAAAAASAAASAAAAPAAPSPSPSSSPRGTLPPPPPPVPISPVATFAGGAIMGAVTDASYSCDGRRLVGGMGDARLLVWEASTGQLRHALTGHTGAVVAARCYPLDPGWCASAGEDRALKLWDLARGTCARSVPCAKLPNALALAADGSGALITGHVDGSLCVWDFRQGGARPAAAAGGSGVPGPVGEAKDHPGTILCVAPVGPIAAGGGGGGGGTGGPLSTGGAVAAAYGSSGASAVLTVCKDNAARVWDYRRMQVVCVLRAGPGALVGGGGSGTGGVAAGAGFCAGSMGGMGRGRCRAGVSPDGRFVAVGGADGGVYVWDMAAVGRAAAAGGAAAGGPSPPPPPGCVAALRHHRDSVVAAAWSADGEMLATGDRGGNLALWRMEEAAVV